jgi:hypothetical protein
MHRDDLRYGLARLTGWFNKRDINEEQAEEWWSRFKHTDGLLFRDAVGLVISDDKFMPTPTQMAAKVGEVMSRRKRDHWVRFEDVPTNTEYAAACQRQVARFLKGALSYEQSVANQEALRQKYTMPALPWKITGDSARDRAARESYYKKRGGRRPERGVDQNSSSMETWTGQGGSSAGGLSGSYRPGDVGRGSPASGTETGWEDPVPVPAEQEEAGGVEQDLPF